MVTFPLLGGSYTSQSVNAECQLTKNWYPERVETDGKVVLYPTPGLVEWPVAMLPVFPPIYGTIQQLIPYPLYTAMQGGYLLAVASGSANPIVTPQLFRIDSSGTGSLVGGLVGLLSSTWRFAVGIDSILICAANIMGSLSVSRYDVLTSSLSIPIIPEPCNAVAYINGYFLAMSSYSSKIYFTLDSTTWDALDFFVVSSTSDLNQNIIIDHGELWIFGQLTTQVYALTGDPDTPFQPNISGFIQQGIAAPDSLVQLDNTLFWIGGDIRGQGIGWRANGYIPQRVTTHAVEYAWSQYSTIADARAFAYQDQGHSFWVINFPTANATWVYDVATGLWHERSYLNDGAEEAAIPQCHAFFFGKHLVGSRINFDPSLGGGQKIFEMKIPEANGSGGWNFVTDDGDTIRRTRRAACLSKDQKRVKYSQMQVYLESGLGPIPALVGPIPGGSIDSLFFTNGGSTPRFPVGDWQFVSVQNDDSSVVQQGTVNIPTATGYVTLTLPNPYTATGWTVYGSSDNWQTIYGWLVAGPLMSPATGADLHFADTTTVAPFPYTRAPQMMLRWSNDGGHTWPNEYQLDCGQAGEYSARVIQRRLGQGRNRVFEISVTDPIPWRIIAGEVQAEECDS